MSKTLLKITIIVLCISFYACKNETETTFTDYKYTDKENVLKCDNVDTKLYHEALESFENDIVKFYDNKNADPRLAYSTFFRSLLGNRVVFQDVVSPHSMKVFEALKEDSDLWNANNTVNYKADIFKCLSSNFQNKSLATTFNSLVETNSMRLDIFSAPLQKGIKNAHLDRYLATYIALDLYYANLFNVDPTQVTENKTTDETSIIRSKKQLNTPVIDNTDPHAGHDHD